MKPHVARLGLVEVKVRWKKHVSDGAMGLARGETRERERRKDVGGLILIMADLMSRRRIAQLINRTRRMKEK